MKKLALLSFVMCLFVASCEKNDLGLPINCAPNEIVYKTQYGYPIELKEGYDDFGGAVLVANLCEKGYCKYVFDANVTKIPDEAFSERVSLLSMVIPNSVTSIGDSAFEDCSSLTSVTIPNSVISIGNEAFFGCKSLTSVTIGDSVTSIGSYAFYGCSNLTSVYISDLSAWCKISFGSNDANPLYYAKNLYLKGKLITELTIPSNITEIKSCTFYNCRCLTSVTIPNSVTSIGSFAFYNCWSLTSVYCKPTTPPTGDDGMFSCFNSYNGYRPIGGKIYVPRNSVEAYKAAKYWSDYDYYIEGYDF